MKRKGASESPQEALRALKLQFVELGRRLMSPKRSVNPVRHNVVAGAELEGVLPPLCSVVSLAHLPELLQRSSVWVYSPSQRWETRSDRSNTLHVDHHGKPIADDVNLKATFFIF